MPEVRNGPTHDYAGHAGHAGHVHGPGAHAHQGHEARAPGANLVKDPVCGMTVDPHATKHRAQHGGRPYWFCSAGCRSKFIADPQKYTA
ncbi:MAG TPA: YHS domain-containing protein, partial [Microvirga sp.]|nr:YHS domain-containing protein [Microvirga sp.]